MGPGVFTDVVVFLALVLAGVGLSAAHITAFGVGSARDEHVKVGVLTASTLAAVLAAAILRSRNRAYRQQWIEEQRDRDDDGTPDVYEATP